MFIAALLTIAKAWKQPKRLSTDKCIKKMWCTHTHTHTHTMEYYLVIKKGNLAIWDNINGPWEHYAEWNKSDRERQILYIITYMWNLKNKIKNEYNKTETDSQI